MHSSFPASNIGEPSNDKTRIRKFQNTYTALHSRANHLSRCNGRSNPAIAQPAREALACLEQVRPLIFPGPLPEDTWAQIWQRQQATAGQETAGQETAGQETAGQEAPRQAAPGQETAEPKTARQETTGQEKQLTTDRQLHLAETLLEQAKQSLQTADKILSDTIRQSGAVSKRTPTPP